ncbi:peptidase inhibitor family I36 protein [Thermomonospora echinospora]|uniref:peptidase inhibitor family I36 protein n=1 Tax=Thermomonospora echinospora TaxID=1992 RepID=UPI00135CE330|nr:peptidase inhibitor family I36 protein [Thermomonospora echinospora]
MGEALRGAPRSAPFRIRAALLTGASILAVLPAAAASQAVGPATVPSQVRAPSDCPSNKICFWDGANFSGTG